MKHNDACTQYCGLARAAGIVGENWTLLILRQLMLLGNTRFDEIQEKLQVSKHLLSTRLKSLKEHDIVEQYATNGKSSHKAYRLTKKGQELFPALLALLEWGEKYELEGKPPVRHIHTKCDHTTKAKVTCSHCDEKLTAKTFTFA